MACPCYLVDLDDFKNYALFQILFRAAVVLFMIVPFGLYTLYGIVFDPKTSQITEIELYYIIAAVLLCFTFWLVWVLWINFAFKIDYPTDKNEKWLQKNSENY